MGQKFQGITILMSDDDVTYVEVGEITGYDLDEGERGEIDTTHSTSDRKEFLLGLQESGALNVDIQYVSESAGYAMAQASKGSDDPYYFRIDYANPITPTTGTSTLHEFQGHVKTLTHTGSVDDKLTGAIGTKILGEISETAAT